jgi:Ca2+-binding RTX toxin-like protein
VTLVDPGGSSPGFPKGFRAPLPNVAGHRALIAPYEQYLSPELLGEIYFKAYPTYAVVQWEQVKLYGFDCRPTFQAVIYADGSIRFNYKSIPLTPDGYYISGYLAGIQNTTGDVGLGTSWYTTAQQGLLLHAAAPVSLSFAAPASALPWATASLNTVGGNPLSWDLVFQAPGLPLGNNDAVLQLRKNANSPVLYSRLVRLNILPPGTSGNDTLIGTTGDDSLAGLDGNDTLNGNAGADTLLGGLGNDIIRGGTGNDVMNGDEGKDSYYYDLGDGNDVITDYKGIFEPIDSNADYSDCYFGAGITPSMIRSSYLPNYNGTVSAMKFEVLSSSPGSITLTHWNMKSTLNVYTFDRWRFHFQDGTIWSGKLFPCEIATPFEGFTGGDLGDVMTGTSGSERLRGMAGNDELKGGLGADRYDYRWGDGNDVIEPTFDPATSDICVLNFDPSIIREEHLTFDWVPPSNLRINISNPSNVSKNGSVILRNFFRVGPVAEKDRWKIRVGNSAGAPVDVAMKDSDNNGQLDFWEIDTDSDGIPDSWELAHGFNPLVANSSTDLQTYLETAINHSSLQIHTPLQ